LERHLPWPRHEHLGIDAHDLGTGLVPDRNLPLVLNDGLRLELRHDHGERIGWLRLFRPMRSDPHPKAQEQNRDQQVSHCRRCSLAFLIRADELRFRKHMALHGVEDLSLDWLLQVGQHGVQGVELMEIAMPSNRRAWTAIASFLPIVESGEVALWN